MESFKEFSHLFFYSNRKWKRKSGIKRCVQNQRKAINNTSNTEPRKLIDGSNHWLWLVSLFFFVRSTLSKANVFFFCLLIGCSFHWMDTMIIFRCGGDKELWYNGFLISQLRGCPFILFYVEEIKHTIPLSSIHFHFFSFIFTWFMSHAI